MEKRIVSAALTGVLPTKEQNPAVPYTPKEIAEDAHECWQAGAAIVHLHMRDEDGKGTMDIARFRETVGLIREKCDVVINLTTSGDLNATDATRMLHIVELKPELASFDAGTMNWMHETLFVNHPKFLETLGSTMQEHSICPEIEIFDAGMYYNALHYMKKGFLSSPGYFQFCLGVPGGIGASPENLMFLKNLLPDGTHWSAFGVGAAHLPILYTAIALGGHVRVGMEDNIFFKKGQLAKSNAEFVNRAAKLIAGADVQVASSSDARDMLRLRS